jgi:hypothetical protein
MVARILTGTSIRGFINYNESKVGEGMAELILASRFGLDIEQLELRHKVARFEHLTKLNSTIKTNAMHIMLNFEHSEKLEVEKLQSIATSYMDRIGFGEQPFLVYRHIDASHPHIHIVTTNVKSDASRMDIHNIGMTLSETARKEIEVEYKLIKAEGRGREKQIVPVNISAIGYGEKPTKRSIYNVVTAVLRSYKFTSLAEYNAVLRDFNVIADRGAEDSMMFLKRGLVYSILDANGKRVGIPFKASSFAGRPTLNKVENKFSFNEKKRKINAVPLKRLITDIMETHRQLNKKSMIKALRKEGVSMHFRENADGRIYGLTYVDHNTRSVFNGSDLGKQYSAKAILERLANNKIEAGELQGQGKVFRDVVGHDPVHERVGTKTAVDLLHFLMEKPAYDPVVPATLTRKRKKKKKGLSKNITLSKT